MLARRRPETWDPDLPALPVKARWRRSGLQAGNPQAIRVVITLATAHSEARYVIASSRFLPRSPLALLCQHCYLSSAWTVSHQEKNTEFGARDLVPSFRSVSGTPLPLRGRRVERTHSHGEKTPRSNCRDNHARGPLVPVSDAHAADACANPHCYAAVYSLTDGTIYNGVSANINYTCMAVPSTGNPLITQQIWVATDGPIAPSPDNTPGQRWVEAGIYRGVVAGGAGIAYTPTYFWGRLAPDTGYQTWQASAWGTPPKNTSINFTIVRNSGGYTWQIKQGGRLMHYSSGMSLCS
jgi:hypothetical protein